MASEYEGATKGDRLAKNVFWNLAGTAAPLIVAVVAIPLLIDGMGIARFGVLTLAWVVVGYFSLFDLGLGRALTKLVAEKLGEGLAEEIPSLVWTAMLFMLALGLVGMLVAAAFAPWLVSDVLKIPAELLHETLVAFYILAGSIPIVVLTTGLRGILEAHQRFGLVNAVRMPLGMVTFLGPLATLPFSSSLVPVVAVLVIARLVSLAAFAVLCLRIEPGLRHTISFDRETIRPLIRFGGWMTVTNIVSPILAYIDRFFIGAMVSIAAVAYYATPFEIVYKLGIIPGALMGVVFPAFASTLVNDIARATRLYDRAVTYIFLALYPLVLVIVTLGNEGLTLWLGEEFAGNSTIILQLLVVGVFVNGLAQVPFGLVQSAGRPDLTAKLHLGEVVFYLPMLWWLLDLYGIIGAAIAWLLRITVDTIALFVMAKNILPTRLPFTVRPILLFVATSLILLLGATITSITVKAVFLVAAVVGFSTGAWFVILGLPEKTMILSRLKITTDSKPT